MRHWVNINMFMVSVRQCCVLWVRGWHPCVAINECLTNHLTDLFQLSAWVCVCVCLFSYFNVLICVCIYCTVWIVCITPSVPVVFLICLFLYIMCTCVHVFLCLFQCVCKCVLITHNITTCRNIWCVCVCLFLTWCSLSVFISVVFKSLWE